MSVTGNDTLGYDKFGSDFRWAAGIALVGLLAAAIAWKVRVVGWIGIAMGLGFALLIASMRDQYRNGPGPDQVTVTLPAHE
ncbi:hypothetical protein CHU93_09645 [Sandarakinorhabdus cyanobacteriorum]|uniref:Uncharacterized protein n=1 Tax=Sandarakinorhabdus cyanobacteriorum TaxID=1981098 RepID=A0A255YGA7_9SPHN|nr:hypothetical protein CHU93_09645 [Sandarakinorhabdus cyanobacteriorum]